VVWLDTSEIGKSVSSHFSLWSPDIQFTRCTIRKNLFKAAGHYGESETSKTRNSFIPPTSWRVFLRRNDKNTFLNSAGKTLSDH